MDRKVILCRYNKEIYRNVNKIIMNLVSIKNLGKSRKISDGDLFKKILDIKESTYNALVFVMESLDNLFLWAELGCQSAGILLDNKKNNMVTFRKRVKDNPSEEIEIDKESIISVEKDISSGALIKYNDGIQKEFVTFEKFNEVIVQLGFEVEYKNGRYITKQKSSNSIKISELKEKLDEILNNNGDIELSATFSVVRGDDEYKIRNTGNIDRIIEFCKQKIEKPEKTGNYNLDKSVNIS